MSWWDTKQLTSFASNALKTAQKKIDKVLDIKEDEKEEISVPNVEELQAEQQENWTAENDSKLLNAASDFSNIKLSSTSTFSESPMPSSKSLWDSISSSDPTKQPQTSTFDTSFNDFSASFGERKDNGDDEDDCDLKNLTTLEKKMLSKKTRNKIGSANSAFRKVRTESNRNIKKLEKSDQGSPRRVDSAGRSCVDVERLRTTGEEKIDYREEKKESFKNGKKEFKKEKEGFKEENKDGEKNIVKSENITGVLDELGGKDDEKELHDREGGVLSGKLQMNDVTVDMKMSSCWSEASLISFNQEDDGDGGEQGGGSSSGGGYDNGQRVNDDGRGSGGGGSDGEADGGTRKRENSENNAKIAAYLKSCSQEGGNEKKFGDNDDEAGNLGNDDDGDDGVGAEGAGGSKARSDELKYGDDNDEVLEGRVERDGGLKGNEEFQDEKNNYVEGGDEEEEEKKKEEEEEDQNNGDDRVIMSNIGEIEMPKRDDGGDKKDGKSQLDLGSKEEGEAEKGKVENEKEEEKDKMKKKENYDGNVGISNVENEECSVKNEEKEENGVDEEKNNFENDGDDDDDDNNDDDDDDNNDDDNTTKRGVPCDASSSVVEAVGSSLAGLLGEASVSTLESCVTMPMTENYFTPPPLHHTPQTTSTTTQEDFLKDGVLDKGEKLRTETLKDVPDDGLSWKPTQDAASATTTTSSSSSSYFSTTSTTTTIASSTTVPSTSSSTPASSLLPVAAGVLSSSSSSLSSSSLATTHLTDTNKTLSDDDSTPTLQSLSNSMGESKDSVLWKADDVKAASFCINDLDDSADTACGLKKSIKDEEGVKDGGSGVGGGGSGVSGGVKLNLAGLLNEALERGKVGSVEGRSGHNGRGEKNSEKKLLDSKTDKRTDTKTDNRTDNKAENRTDHKADTTEHSPPPHTSSPHNSEQTSADEVDTTTSSDIEIISQMSTPSFLGNHYRNASCHGDKTHSSASSNGISSPSNHTGGTKNKLKEDGHTRSDSGSSDKGGEDFVSVDFVREGFVGVCHRKQPSTEDSGQVVQLARENERLMRKLSEMLELLDARERKVLELTRENVDLNEDKCIFKNQLMQSEDLLKSEKEDVEEISKEFSKRIADSESKFQQACREKDSLKKTLQEVELKRRNDNAAYDKVVQEKEETISELLAEGEKLSKQQLQLNTLLKKLRGKEKETEASLKSLRQKNEEQRVKISHFEGVISGLIESDKNQLETINQLKTSSQSNQETIFDLKNELEDAQAKAHSFKTALDNSYKEMSELQKRRLLEAGEAHKAAQHEEEIERLQGQVQEERSRSRLLEAQLMAQLDEMRQSMSNLHGDESRREGCLKEQITELQKRLQEGEDRNQELAQNVSTATRPLLRQIEVLQGTYTTRCSNFENIEKSLSEKIGELQGELSTCAEKEAEAVRKCNEVLAKLSPLELQLTSLQKDKASLEAEMQALNLKLKSNSQDHTYAMTQKNTLITSLENEVSSYKKEKLVLEGRVESEERKAALLLQQVNEKEYLLKMYNNQSTHHSYQTLQLNAISDSTPLEGTLPSNRSSFASVTSDSPVHPHTPSVTPTSSNATTPSSTPTPHDKVAPFKSLHRLHHRQSVYDSSRGMVGTSLVENLQSLLKMRATETNQLQNNIDELERTRDTLSDQIVSLTLKNEQIHERVLQLEQYKQEYEEVNSRYNALLQMYGEKEEQVQELKMDLEDFKQIYKQQMNEVLHCKTHNIPK